MKNSSSELNYCPLKLLIEISHWYIQYLSKVNYGVVDTQNIKHLIISIIVLLHCQIV